MKSLHILILVLLGVTVQAVDVSRLPVSALWSFDSRKYLGMDAIGLNDFNVFDAEAHPVGKEGGGLFVRPSRYLAGPCQPEGAFTIALWVNLHDLAPLESIIIAKWTDHVLGTEEIPQRAFRLVFVREGEDSGRFKFQFSHDGSELYALTTRGELITPAVNHWHRVAFGFDPTARLVFLSVNGKRAEIATGRHTLWQTAVTMSIGGDMTGVIDECAVFDAALNEAQVAEYFGGGDA